MHAISAVSTELFVGTTEEPRQVLAVTIDRLDGEARIVVTGDGVRGEATTRAKVTEVALEVDAPVGAVVTVHVAASDRSGSAEAVAELTVAEPGWTMHLISHFHYDPVWWATQAAYAVTWRDADEMSRRFQMSWQQPGFTLIDTHLDLARRDADYKFVLAEVDLLKPYWDARPDQRGFLRRLVAEGRLELLGGTYNEPNTNLTSAEVTIRNFVYGSGFQRDVFGADPSTAWQLDAFGHDPQFPGLAADAGVTSSSWARGPFRPWGPMLTSFMPGAEGWGDPRSMQFDSEFEWIAPSGVGLLTHYMPAHYSAGWVLDKANSIEDAEAALLEVFTALKAVAATRNVLLPVGTDYTPPNRWVTEVHRHWNDRYVWPRFVCAVPSEFFAAVRAELDDAGRTLSPQSRDMNPIFTGKDVSFIDTKQAHRRAETTVVDAEKFATFAHVLGAGFPHAALDKAWRHLVYGAHHDAVTGSESDQVYLDLLTNWREALDLGHDVLEHALGHLAGLVRTGAPSRSVTVFNPSSWVRDDLVTVRAELPAGGYHGVDVVADDDTVVPSLLEVFDRHDDGSLRHVAVTFLAVGVPGLGYRSWGLGPTGAPAATADASDRGWRPVGAGPAVIESARYRLEVDAAYGGAVSSLRDKRMDRELIAPGGFGNALLRSDEYAEHPTFNEGPWHLLPTGRTARSTDRAADLVRVEESPLGRRIVVEGRSEEVTYRQTLTLWDGVEHLDCRTELHGFAGADQLFRVQWPAGIAGAMPVSEVGHAVIGRGHALIDVDSADHPWTLDNPAYGFFALSSTARIRVAVGDGDGVQRAVNTAEIVAADGHRDLAVALVRCGVTATSSTPDGPRYGHLAVDSNLPDVRVSVGTALDNAFTADVLASAPDHAAEFDRQLRATGVARVWVPARTSLAEAWRPGADLRHVRALPVLLVAGEGAVEALTADLDDAVVDVAQEAPAGDGTPDLDDVTVGLVNRGVPGFAVDTEGSLHLSLMRSCTGWPSGVWIDPPARTAPDGSTFQQQHWSHTFEYALASGAGDWRDTGLVTQAHDVNHPLLAHVHAGGGEVLPASGSFLPVGSDGTVVVSAVKPRGNALAAGRVPDRTTELSVRCYEADGRPATWRVGHPAGITGARRTDLLERDGEPLEISAGVLELPIAAGETATVALTIGTGTSAPDPVFVEPVQPVYARYWLNNTGTAPAGNLPVVPHFVTDSVVVDAAFTVGVTVASSLHDTDAHGTLELVAPDGWVVEPARRPFALAAGAHLRLDVRVTPPEGVEPGCHLLLARLDHGGQQVQDVCRVLVGDAAVEQLTADLDDEVVTVTPGGTGRVTARVGTDAASEVPAQVQLITPWDVWPLVDGWNTGTVIPARGTVDVPFTLDVPYGTPAGRWWVIVKVAAAGQVRFTRAVELVVTAP